MGDLTDIERASFTKLTNEDETLVVEVIQDPIDAVKRLQTSAKGDPQGLKGSWKITTMLITNVAVKIPTTALSDRNFIRIENTEPSKEVWIGPDNTISSTLAVGTTSGKLLDPGESVTLDFKDNLEIWAIAKPGKDALIQIIEAK